MIALCKCWSLFVSSLVPFLRLKMTFLCKVLLLTIVAIFCLRLSSAMDICKEKDKPNFQLKLLGTALFKDHLLLITRDDNHQDYTVYRIPLNNFDNSYGQMLLDIPGVPIEEYWPKFKNDTYWQQIRAHVFSIWLIDKVDPFLYFFVPNSNGRTFNVNNGSWAGPLSWVRPNDTILQFVSDSSASHTYTTGLLNGVYYLIVWAIHLTEAGQFSWTEVHSASNLYYTEHKPSKKLVNTTFMYNYNDRTKIVTPDNDPYLSMPGYEDYRLVNLTDWNLSPDFTPPGFIFKEYFHMFSLDKVFIFAHRLTYEDPKLKFGQIWYTTPVMAVAYKDYFKCGTHQATGATYPPVDPPITSGPKSKLGWFWMVVVALLVVVLLAFLLVCMCYRRKKVKGHHHHGGVDGDHKKRSIHSKGRRDSSLKDAASLKQATSLKRVTTLKRKGTSKRTQDSAR